MNKIITLLLVMFLWNCNTSEKKKANQKEQPTIEQVSIPMLNLEEANRLAQLPLDHSYEGGHWLGSFAIYALNAVDND